MVNKLKKWFFVALVASGIGGGVVFGGILLIIILNLPPKFLEDMFPRLDSTGKNFAAQLKAERYAGRKEVQMNALVDFEWAAVCFYTPYAGPIVASDVHVHKDMPWMTTDVFDGLLFFTSDQGYIPVTLERGVLDMQAGDCFCGDVTLRLAEHKEQHQQGLVLEGERCKQPKLIMKE